MLRGEYNRFLLKSLSHNEETYLNILNKGITNILDASMDYVLLNYESLHSMDDDEEFDGEDSLFVEWFDNYQEEVLITMLLENRSLAIRPLRKFYMGGSRIAYNELGLQQSFYNTDAQALKKLEDYVGGLVESIDSEYCLGVKQCLYDNRYESPHVINEKLMGLSGNPILSNISVDTRCLFTTKTEYARAVNTGLLQTYANYGVSEVDWVTSGFRNVCGQCLEYEANSPYTLEEIQGLLPCHPNCICSVKCRVPVNPSLQRNAMVVDLTPKRKNME